MRHRNGPLWNLPILFIAWISIAPIIAATMVQADTTETITWKSGGPYGGHVHRLARSASDPQILAAGTDDGVYISHDGGESWGPCGLSSQPVATVAFAPYDPRRIYAGTKGGIQRSENGGQTWAPIGPFDTPSGKAHRILDLAISSKNPSILYAVTQSGESYADRYYHVAKSTDRGNSWELKLSKKYADRVISILIDADDPQRIYAGVEEWEIGLYLSTNGGENWEAKRMPTSFSSHQEVVALAMTPAGAGTPRIWALERSSGAFVSLDRGASWADAGLPSIDMNGPYTIAVDPVAPENVYAGTRRWNAARRYFEGLLHKTTDAGASWTTKTLPGLATSLVFGAGSLLYAGLDIGVHQTADAGESWQRKDSGISLAPVAGLAIDPASGKVYAVINEQSSDYLAKFNSYPLAVSSDQGTTWGFLEHGPRNPSGVAVSPGNIIWTGDGYKTTTSLYVQKTSDGGGSWRWINFLNIFPGEVNYGASDILVDSRNPQCVLFGFQHVIEAGILARTTDGGSTWSKLGESTSALAVDPNDPDLIYQGRSTMGGVWAITNPCGAWQSLLIASYTEIGNVSDIAVGSDSKVYAAASDGLWRWDKSNWVKLAGLPKGPPTALAIDRDGTSDLLYVGTAEDGVYVSADGGSTWKAFNNRLGNLQIRKLAFGSGPDKKLYAGTSGGVWQTSRESGPIRRPNPALPLLLLD